MEILDGPILVAGGSVSKGKKVRNEKVIVDDVDDTVKERIVRSDTALQSSSTNHNLKDLSKSKCHDPCTSSAQESRKASSSQKAATDRKEPDHSQKFRLTDGPSVVVYPEHVTYGGNCYQVAKLSFFCSFGRLYVSEKAGAMDSLILEWETQDIISIESRWSDTPETTNICLHIKSENPKVVTSGQNSELILLQRPWGKWAADTSSVEAFLDGDANQAGGNEVDLWSFSDLPAMMNGSF